MKKGSVLVVSLVVVIFLALTVLLVLAIYGQLTSNYALQQKRLLVSNVAKSAAYTMAETVKKWFTDGRKDLVENLAATPTYLSLPEFRGTIICSLIPIPNGYEVKCKATLDNVEDSYSLSLQLLGGLTFPYGIDSDGPVTLGNNVIIKGDVLLRRGDFEIGSGARIEGAVYLMGGTSTSIEGGNFYLGQDAVVKRDVLAVGNVSGATGGAKATIEGSAMVAGTIDKDITVVGTKTTASVSEVRDEISRRLDASRPPLPVTPSFFPDDAIKLDGTVISESNKTYYTESLEGGLSVSNTTLTLKIPSTGVLSIAVTRLDLGNSTIINIEGDGVVMIYVRDKLYANQLTMNMGEQTRLLIYSNSSEDVSDGQEDFYFKNGLTVNNGGLYIYAPQKYVNVENAPNQSTPNINGAIVAKNINMKNSLNLAVPIPLPVEFDPTASGTVYYGLYASYRSWGQ